ncbi:MAG: hypothetical protein KIT80_18030 [Chitinophagaceae bacterium]|nr:hypothetical protein [Chitinophagaceae bacterium]MCW5928825.1 hypothetical protein [Chitinophagaceae bacterium]
MSFITYTYQVNDFDSFISEIEKLTDYPGIEVLNFYTSRKLLVINTQKFIQQFDFEYFIDETDRERFIDLAVDYLYNKGSIH